MEKLPFDRLLLCVTGAFIAHATPIIATALRYQFGVSEIQVMLTHTATRWVSADAIREVTGRDPIVDWNDLSSFGSGGHIEITRWADLLLVYPATAHFISALAGGAAGSPVELAVLGAACPVVICPVMNAAMWRNPLVAANVARIRDAGYLCLENAAGSSLSDDSKQPGVDTSIMHVMRQVVGELRRSGRIQAGKVGTA